LDRNAATASVLATVMMVYGLVLLAVIAFTIWVYWRIFTKAGFNGALSLLNLVPGVGNLICMLILAFGRWPIEDQLDAIRVGTPLGTTVPPAPPGSSVMPAP
jgi:uncharacterized membrane protein YhaH (DUF805 family)